MSLVLGVLGGGQLGRMLALAAARLGVRTRLYDPDSNACGAQVADLVSAPFDDLSSLHRFCDGLAAATVEFENVPANAVAAVSACIPTFPPKPSIEAAQDRVAERELLMSAGFAVPRFIPVASGSEISAAATEIRLPAILKTRRLGYDGKGQTWLRTQADVALAEKSEFAPSIVDEVVSFQREVSLIAVRGRSGEIRHYAPTENEHRAGILVRSVAPAVGLDPKVLAAARASMEDLMHRLDYVGVLAVEFFDVGGRLLANEMAPRVHNSGHWTMDGAVTCQFENHVRAVLGLPLGSTDLCGAALMLNLIGSTPPLDCMLEMPAARVHLYGKAPRAGRKLGHVNWSGPATELSQASRQLSEALKVAGGDHAR